MDSVDLFSKLSNVKTSIEEKIEIFNKLDKELLATTGKEQWLIDYICNCLEGLSNTDEHIIENAKYINDLLCIFNKKLKSLADSENKYFLKGNFYEVLVKYFKYEIISCKHLHETWYHIFQLKNWVKILMAKPNILGEILQNMCQYLQDFEHQSKQEQQMMVDLLLTVLCLFIRQIKSQYNIKKVFQNFCQKLLCELLCTMQKFKKITTLDFPSEIPQHLRNCKEITNKIEEILHIVICQKDLLPSLKNMLAPKDEEPASKKSRTLPLYQYFFDALSIQDGNRQKQLASSAAILYKVIISGSRSLKHDHALTNYEEFQALMKLCNTLAIGKSVITVDVIDTYISCLRVVCDYDIYKPSRDQDNVFFEWMSDLVKRLLHGFSEHDINGKKKILEFLRIILNVNHSILETYLSEILVICLESSFKKDPELMVAQEELLSSTLDTYSKLHKLGYLIQNIALSITSNVYIPKIFVEKFSKMLSTLQISQVLSFLKVYEQMIKEQAQDISSTSNNTLLHVTYLLCYLVLTNASLIPENFYMREDLQDVIGMMGSLKTTMEDTEASIVNEKKDDDVIRMVSSVTLLLRCGINQVVLFLKEFSLIEDDGEEENTSLFTHFNTNTNEKHSYLTKYLKTVHALDEMKYWCGKEVDAVGGDKTHTYKDYLLSLLKEVSAHSHEIAEQKETWNGMILNINEGNIWASLSKLLMENIELFFVYDDLEVSDALAEISWALNLNCGSGENDLEYLIISVYNNETFQTNLVKHIAKSIANVFPKQLSNNLTASFNHEEYQSISKVKTKQLEKLKNIFMGVRRISSSYFSQKNMEAVYNIFLNVFCSTKDKQELLEFNEQCISLLEKLLENTITASYQKNPTPCSVLFESVAEYCRFCLQRGCFNDGMLMVFHPLTQVTCTYLKQDDDAIRGITHQVQKLISEEKLISITIKMLNVCLDGVREVLRLDYMITKGNANTIIILMESLLAVILKTLYTDNCFAKHQSEAISLYSSFCFIIDKLLRGRKVTCKMETLDDNMVKCFKTIAPVLQKKLTEDVRECNLQNLQIISFVMSQSELGKKMKELLECDELGVLSVILSSVKDNCDEENKRQELTDVLKKVVLDLGEEKLRSFLTLLTEKLNEVFQNKNSSYLLEVWEQVLKCKWPKEKRSILWTSLPKVVETSVHLICMKSRPSDSLILLRILSSIMPITRHSFVVPFLSMVYHVYNDCLLQMLQYNQRNRLADTFEELYQVLSLLLFHHPSIVFSSIQSYINCLNNLFNAFVNSTKKHMEGIPTEDVERSYNRMSRLYFELGSHKENISKYSPYIIGGYIRVFSSTYIPGNYKTIMDTGIYEIFKTCSDYELGMMSTVFELAEREHFRMLRDSFEKYHKFQGKA